MNACVGVFYRKCWLVTLRATVSVFYLHVCVQLETGWSVSGGSEHAEAADWYVASATMIYVLRTADRLSTPRWWNSQSRHQPPRFIFHVGLLCKPQRHVADVCCCFTSWLLLGYSVGDITLISSYLSFFFASSRIKFESLQYILAVRRPQDIIC